MKFSTNHVGIRHAKIRVEHDVTMDDLVILVAEAIAGNGGKTPDNLTGRYAIESFVMMMYHDHGALVTERAGTFLVDDVTARICEQSESKAVELVLAFFPELRYDSPGHKRRWGDNKRKQRP